MAAKATHNIVVKTGEYTCHRTGQTKARWLNIGKVFRHDDGKTSIKLDAIPLLKDWDGWARVYPIEDNQQITPQEQARGFAKPMGQGNATGNHYHPEEPEEVPF